MSDQSEAASLGIFLERRQPSSSLDSSARAKFNLFYRQQSGQSLRHYLGGARRAKEPRMSWSLERAGGLH